MSETNLRNITKSGSNFVPTFIDNHVLLDINLNEYRLINNISTPKKLYIYIYIYIYITKTTTIAHYTVFHGLIPIFRWL